MQLLCCKNNSRYEKKVHCITVLLSLKVELTSHLCCFFHKLLLCAANWNAAPTHCKIKCTFCLCAMNVGPHQNSCYSDFALLQFVGKYLHPHKRVCKIMRAIKLEYPAEYLGVAATLSRIYARLEVIST